jgi:hypothetical protein
MSDRKRNIADRFSGFEPDVDDSTIDKSWEKIKYFLPQEEKKRAFVWFQNKGLGRTLWVLLTLGLCGAFVGLFLHGRQTEKTLAVAPEHKTTLRQAQGDRNAVDDLKTVREKAKNGNQGTSQNISTAQRAAGQSSGITPAKKEDNASPENGGVKTPSASALRGSSVEAAPISTIPPADEDNKNTSPVKEKGTLVSDKAADPAITETLAYEQLQPVFLNRISKDRNDSIPLSFIEIKREGMPAPTLLRRWSIELFGGPYSSHTQMKYGEDLLEPRKHPLDFSLGLGLVFQMNRKWNVYANGRLNRNSFSYENELQGNRVVDRQLVITGSIPLIPADTIIRYLPSTSLHKISSLPAYNVCLGAGYSLLKKGKISLEASLGLSLKYSTYHTGIQNSQQPDTLKYTRTLTSPPLANEIRLPGEYGQKQTFISWGLAPGLVMVYQFHSRFGFIARPSGFIQLSKGNSRSGQEPYRLQQNNFFMDVGLRIKL